MLTGWNTFRIITTYVIYTVSTLLLGFFLDFKNIDTRGVYGAVEVFIFIGAFFNSLDSYSNLEKLRNKYAENFFREDQKRIKREILEAFLKNQSKEIFPKFIFTSN